MINPERPQQGKGSGRRTGARRVQGGSKLARALMHPVGKAFLVLALVTVVSGAGAFIYYYQKYAKLIDDRLKGGPFTSTSRIYAAPEPIAVGDITSPAEIATELRAAGDDALAKLTAAREMLASLYRSLRPSAARTLTVSALRELGDETDLSRAQ